MNQENETPTPAPREFDMPTTFELTQLATSYCAHSESGYGHPAQGPKESRRGVFIKVLELWEEASIVLREHKEIQQQRMEILHGILRFKVKEIQERIKEYKGDKARLARELDQMVFPAKDVLKALFRDKSKDDNERMTLAGSLIALAEKNGIPLQSPNLPVVCRFCGAIKDPSHFPTFTPPPSTPEEYQARKTRTLDELKSSGYLYCFVMWLKMLREIQKGENMDRRDAGGTKSGKTDDGMVPIGPKEPAVDPEGQQIEPSGGRRRKRY